MNPTTDNDPLAADEWVLRRIPAVYFNPHDPIPIKSEAFRPTNRDTNGLSVFRERFVSPEHILATVEPERRVSVQIIRLPVPELTSMGLTVVPDPIPDLPGHALIPEINVGDYKARKQHWKEVQYQLAILASRCVVV